MITVTGASKRYGDFAALDDVSIHIPSGSLTALLGPSGSGSRRCCVRSPASRRSIPEQS